MIKPKPYNGGQWTQARMMSFLRSNLRLASRKWGPIQQAKRNARKPYVGPNKRRKWSSHCDGCDKWFKESETKTHHKHPCGSFRDWGDMEQFARNLFSEVENYLVLCEECHKAIHDKEREENKRLKELESQQEALCLD